MSTEKIIRNQAKKSLVGNWSVIIFAVMAVCASAILLESVLYFIGYYFKLYDIETGVVYGQRKLIYYIVSIAVGVAGVFASPLINGVLKMSGNVALYNNTEINDVFYYFKGVKRYFKTLCINIALAVLCVVLFYGLDVYELACYLLKADLHKDFGFDIITLVLIGAFLVSIVIKILIYLIFVHYPLMAYSLDDSKKVFKYIFGYMGFSVKNLGKTIKLMLSFTGWIALCFFVVPAFYVLPYLLVSATNSAKWLFLLDKSNN